MAMKAFMEPMGTDLVGEDPFDSIDDLLDFPNEDDGFPMGDAWGSCAPLAPEIVAGESGGGIDAGSASSGLDGGAAALSGDGISSENDALGLYDDIDVANLEWLSNFFEDSELNLDFIPNSNPQSKPDHTVPSLSRSSSPSSSSSSSSSSSCPAAPPPASAPARARTRTKRPRLPSSSALSFTPPSPPAAAASPPAAPAKKIKKDLIDSPPSARKCTHCDIQKTPQWRAGPMGPKTLCNACGVRYKSGRLFPEYRPAASPTFAPAAHSNSHKKVVEMRLRCAQMAGRNCDLIEYIRRRD